MKSVVKNLPLYDAHNHLHDARLAPHHERIFADLASAGVRACVVNGTCESDWPDVAALCRLQLSPFNLQLLPSYGLHPWDAGNRSPDWQKKLLAALDAHPSHPSHSSPASHLASVALGEFGLDRWILDRARPDDPRLADLRRAPLAEQMEVFLWQLDLAAARNLPASIHCLDAHGALLDALRAAKLPARGFLLHAYSGPVEMIKNFADLGAYFSFNGSFLPPRPSSGNRQLIVDNTGRHRRLETFRLVPPDRLLVETDAPAMRLTSSLEKFPPLAAADGSLANHPANLAPAYAALAGLRGVGHADLVRQVEDNFCALFDRRQT